MSKLKTTKEQLLAALDAEEKGWVCVELLYIEVEKAMGLENKGFIRELILDALEAHRMRDGILGVLENAVVMLDGMNAASGVVSPVYVKDILG